ncbi:MAG: DUF4251 domain-containing protein [Bacteroidota bacterium]|nr:DUF4251 domain-containing protein [Bacteroidota bacterium]
MKELKYIFAFLIACFLFSSCSTSKQNSTSGAKSNFYSNMLDSQNFRFVAQSTNPSRGRLRNLTSYYDVTVSKDTMQSYLPYFGRSYNPMIGETTSPLDFTSTNFSYSVLPVKKDAWSITIKPKDKPSIQQYYFTIFNNGAATLNVTSTSSDPISFNGRIEKKK